MQILKDDFWYFLKSYDPEYAGGRGKMVGTADPAAAMLFNTPEEGWILWNTQPRSKPFRKDGRPNRPLTAFTIMMKSEDNEEDVPLSAARLAGMIADAKENKWPN